VWDKVPYFLKVPEFPSLSETKVELSRVDFYYKSLGCIITKVERNYNLLLVFSLWVAAISRNWQQTDRRMVRTDRTLQRKPASYHVVPILHGKGHLWGDNWQYLRRSTFDGRAWLHSLLQWATAHVHGETEKRNQFSFACIFFNTWQKLVNFSYTMTPKESRCISYNSVNLILACIENVAVTVTLNILCLPVKQWNWWLPASVYCLNFITVQKFLPQANTKYMLLLLIRSFI